MFLVEEVSLLVLLFISIVIILFAVFFRKFLRHIINSQQNLNNDFNDNEPLLLNNKVVNPFSTIELVSSPHTFLSMHDIPWSNKLTIFMNGSTITLVNPSPSELLVTFIRETIGLKGTKLGCEEGGCGACTVVLTKPDEEIISVNSCLRPLCANDGMAVTTVEGIGSVKHCSSGAEAGDNLSPEQQRLVANNGTQCGYCTPGWVTNMYALNQSNAAHGTSSTKKEIDAYLDGNICRCTGYRPIIQAFQTFAEEAQPSLIHPASCLCSCCIKIRENNVGNTTSITGGRNPCEVLQCSAEKQKICHQAVYNSCMNDLEDACGNHQNECKSKVTRGSISRPLGSHKAQLDRTRDLELIRAYEPQPLYFNNPVTNQTWIRPVSLNQLCAVLRHVAPTLEDAKKVQLVGGNTSIGVSKYLNGSGPYFAADVYSTFIDVNSISVMTAKSYDSINCELSIGACVPISSVISLLEQYSIPLDVQLGNTLSKVLSPQSSESATGNIVNHHSVFSVTANHLSKIANTQVRNAGSWAGNLMLYLRYPTFPSDAVLALLTANANLQLCDRFGQLTVIDMKQFMSFTIDTFQSAGYMIVGLIIKEKTSSGSNIFITETFKIAQRTRNAHAHVNAGFQFEITQSTFATTISPLCISSRIIFGGVSNVIFEAKRAQKVLCNGASITSVTLQKALVALQLDLKDAGKCKNELGSQLFRESVMQTCLYRALLRCYPLQALPHSVISAVLPWNLPISRGLQLFVPPHGEDAQTNTNPIGKPVHKLEGPIQSTGEAKYPSDESMSSQGLYGAIVYSTQCAKKLKQIDFTQALKLPGVVRVFTATDIPGLNQGVSSMKNRTYLFVPIGQEVECVGAQLAVVVATSEVIANEASALVVVEYEDIGKTPITNIEQAIQQRSFYKAIYPLSQGNADDAMETATYRVKGHLTAGGQYHFYMEAQSAVASIEDGQYVTVVCGTQNPVLYQSHIAALLDIPMNNVIVKCSRTGGGFGGKLTSGIPVSGAAALCANKLGRSIRIFNSRTSDMEQQSGREGWIVDYEVGYNSDGLIVALKYMFYVDAGIDDSDTIGSLYMGMNWADNAYYLPNYKAIARICYTNTPPRTSMRAPGVVQTSLFTEMVIERVALELGLPISAVQEKNFIKDGEVAICGQVITDSTLPTVWSTLLQRSRFNSRLSVCNQYNTNNLWRKRGIAICPVKYGMGWSGYNAGVQLGVSSEDGTVTLCHNGCEVGQGINTKAAQAVAMALGIDLTLIRVVATSTDKVVNGGITGGSATSEVVVQAALNACKTLNDRLDPYRSSFNNKVDVKMSTKDWQTLLSSLPSDVSLNTEGWYSPTSNPNGQVFQYFVYAALVTELELDVLSGEVHIQSAEMVYDCGQSLNPAVDIGQIEGALVMALGYYLTERVEYNKTNGQLLTAGTWEYKPPLAQDIPGLINITLLKNKYNQSGILGSKAVGEPPYIVSNSVYFALKMAINSARKDALPYQPNTSNSSSSSSSNNSNATTTTTVHFALDVPATVDQRQLSCLVTPNRFVMPY